MIAARSLALGALAAFTLTLAACGGRATSALPLGTGNLAPAAHSVSPMHGNGQDADVDTVAQLRLLLDRSGNATFAFGGDDDGFAASSTIVAPVPAFTLSCARNDARDGRIGRDDDERTCHFGDERHDEPAYYYVRERVDGDEHQRDARPAHGHGGDDENPGTIVTGPGNPGTGGIAFPAANQPLTLAAHVRYFFELVRSNVPLTTPTPVPTPTPTATPSSIGFCRSYAGTIAGSAPSAATPAPATASAAPGFITSFANAAIAVPALASLACGPSGTIDEAGSGNGTGSLAAFSQANTSFATLSTLGTGQSILRLNATQIAVDASGNLYASAFAAGTGGGKAQSGVVEVSPAGTVTFIGITLHPYAFGTGADGAAYVLVPDQLGTASYDVVRISNGVAATAVALPASCTSINANGAFAADARGNLWFSDATCGIVRYAIASGTFTTHAAAPTSAGANAIAVGPDGAVYIAIPDAIVRFDTTTNALATYAFAGSSVDAMVAGPAGDLYLAAHADDFSQYWIERLTPATGALVQYPAPINGIRALVMGSDYLIYGAANADQLVRIDPALAGP